MGLVDVCALLRIPNLEEDDYWNRGDATIIYCGELQALDQLSHYLRCRFGDQLDAHDDPRGIFFFISEHFEPKEQSYNTLIAELGGDKISAGKSIERARKISLICEDQNDYWYVLNYLPCWSPIVGEDHIPYKYSKAEAGSVDEMICALIHKSGRTGETIARSMTSRIWRKYHRPKSNLSKWSHFPPELKAELDEATAALDEVIAVEFGEEGLGEFVENPEYTNKALADFMNAYEQAQFGTQLRQFESDQVIDWQDQVNEIANLMGKDFATELEARMIAEAKKA